MTAINRQPQGLLGFLGIKNFGRNPTTLNENLAGTWDLSKLYLTSNAWYTRVTVNVNTVGYLVPFLVPEGQVWWIHELGWFTENVIPVAEELEAAIMMGPTASPIPISYPKRVAPSYFGCDGWQGALVLSAGEQIGLYVTRNVGAAKNVSFSCRRTVMAI